MAKNRVAIIRRELVELTGDYRSALALNQFLYWTKVLQHHDDIARQEIADAAAAGRTINRKLRHGWIYKKAEELIDELMIGVSAVTMRRILSKMIEDGWLEERRNPDNAMDRIMQYKVNISRVTYGLAQLGYSLDGYLTELTLHYEGSNLQNEVCATTRVTALSPIKSPVASNLQNEGSKLQNEGSNLHFEGAIPIEYKSKNTSHQISVSQSDHVTADCDRQTEFETLLHQCNLESISPSLWKPVFEYMYCNPTFAKTKDTELIAVQSRMKYITEDILASVHNRIVEHILTTKPDITNLTAYLASALYNEISKYEMDNALRRIKQAANDYTME